MNTRLLQTQFTGSVPVRQGERIVYLNGRITVSHLKAALRGCGYVLKADRDGLRITLPERIVL